MESCHSGDEMAGGKKEASVRRMKEQASRNKDRKTENKQSAKTVGRKAWERERESDRICD